MFFVSFFFFFKQKTAYELRISDWSSDVCSSDLLGISSLVGMAHHHHDPPHTGDEVHGSAHALDHLARDGPVRQIPVPGNLHRAKDREIDMPTPDHRETVGRAEEARCRQRGDG